jgi:Fur family ferric uptake transcriptional regulator
MESSDILEKVGLRKTAFRKELLSLFLNINSSLSVEEIRSGIKDNSDKVTIYRALEVFEKHGIIHKVPDRDQRLRFARCSSECSTHKHNHKHVHFICDDCGKTYCLNDMHPHSFTQYEGFHIRSSETILKGCCNHCYK